MAAIVFHRLRQLGATVDVRRVDADGGFALAQIDGAQISVDVYADDVDRVLLMREQGDYLITTPDDVADAILREWGTDGR